MPGPTPAPAVEPAPGPLVNVPNVISAGPSTGGLGVTVGTPSAPVIHATATPTCTGVQVLNIVLNTCQTPPASHPPSLIGGLLGGL